MYHILRGLRVCGLAQFSWRGTRSVSEYRLTFIFGGLGAEEDALVPPELEVPAPFSEGVRNAGLLDLDLFDSNFPGRL